MGVPDPDTGGKEGIELKPCLSPRHGDLGAQYGAQDLGEPKGEERQVGRPQAQHEPPDEPAEEAADEDPEQDPEPQGRLGDRDVAGPRLARGVEAAVGNGAHPDGIEHYEVPGAEGKLEARSGGRVREVEVVVE